MRDDLSKSISQRSDSEKDAENNRIKQIFDELTRRCQLYEEESGNGKSHVNALDIEQRVAEIYAKENQLWIPMPDLFDLGLPGPSGHENDTYVSGNNIFNVNNLLNSGGVVPLLKRVILHNIIFPETFYFFVGFTGYEGRSVMPILRQDLIKDARPATTVEIDTYMSALGFTKCSDDGKYQNTDYIVWDVMPRNVLKDAEGDIYVVDAEIKSIC